MRKTALVAALLVAAVFWAVDNKSVQAQPQNPQTQPNTTKAESKKVQVRPGDYLAKIAREQDTTYPRLFDANTHIKDPDVILVGDTLRVPHPDEELPSRGLPSDAPAAVSQPAPVVKKQVTVPKQPAAVKPRAVKQTAAAVSAAVSGGVWDRLAACESGGRWHLSTGNGFYGGLQFTLSSWRAVGGSGYPHQASKAEQIARAEKLMAIQGWGAWPACSSKLGLR